MDERVNVLTRPAMTSKTWPEACRPTTEEFLPWFLEQSPEAQAWIWDRMREDADLAHRCRLLFHEDYIEHQREVINQIARDKGAWIPAAWWRSSPRLPEEDV